MITRKPGHVDSVREVAVTRVVVLVGDGTMENLYRDVTEYWLGGVRLARVDPSRDGALAQSIRFAKRAMDGEKIFGEEDLLPRLKELVELLEERAL